MSDPHNNTGLLGSPQGARIALLIITLALVLMGTVMVYSAGSIEALSEGASPESYLIKHAAYGCIGIVCGVVVWKVIPYAAWRGPLLWGVWAAAIVMLVLTSVMGIVGLGAQRWLVLGPISLQPSEFAKIALVMMTVHQFALLREGQSSGRDFLVRVGVLVLIPLLFLYKTQSDLGTTAIIAVGILAVMWLGEVPKKWIAIICGALVVFVIIAIFGTGYRSDRMVYLHPWDDGEDGYGKGLQIIRSYCSLADGGLFGVGLGNSRGKYSFLPESETDFIFAIVVEELGMLGGIVIIGLFVGMLFAGIAIARQSSDSFGTMLAGSLTSMIVFQAFLNISCVIGILPTTGKPLPFVSSGGSSLIASLIMVGLVLAVSEGAGTSDVYERRRANLRVVRAVPDSDSAQRMRSRRSESRSMRGKGRR
ncbi:FtsW/RodA/SpoVE family cell cycle protein [Adlercreutzia sp. ZJ141]|uniref:FtsW/RodA/SpoVE family cell cycle protein n=1 Tax=Adlercreutzia sp. ZJ141 TaxID=2709406 RepID=UPI0013EC672C|nr:putative peptidoglycan glycosyltransferase FtsW [Adlercreutzia sp. ZJ141]